jgi:hypothetical protein
MASKVCTLQLDLPLSVGMRQSGRWTFEHSTTDPGSLWSFPTGKQHITPFDEGKSWRAQRVLQLVNAYICGPMNMASTTDAKYFLLFIEDYNRKMWVYILKLKSKVFNEFQNFKSLVEKELGCHITSLRPDNGGEFYSEEFNNFCAKHGIKR